LLVTLPINGEEGLNIEKTEDSVGIGEATKIRRLKKTTDQGSVNILTLYAVAEKDALIPLGLFRRNLSVRVSVHVAERHAGQNSVMHLSKKWGRAERPVIYKMEGVNPIAKIRGSTARHGGPQVILRSLLPEKDNNPDEYYLFAEFDHRGPEGETNENTITIRVEVFGQSDVDFDEFGQDILGYRSKLKDVKVTGYTNGDFSALNRPVVDWKKFNHRPKGVEIGGSIEIGETTTLLKGNVKLERPQGDVPMGKYGPSPDLQNPSR